MSENRDSVYAYSCNEKLMKPRKQINYGLPEYIAYPHNPEMKCNNDLHGHFHSFIYYII